METKKIIEQFKRLGPRVETKARVKLKSRHDFSLWYTPGVGAAASYLAKNPKDARLMSVKKNSVAVVSDGSAVLGLGNIGPYGALPVMEGKALIFKEKAGIDAWPIVLTVHEPAEIVAVVKAIAPAFGGINLEDIAAPACFAVEEALARELDIPVMHDDQHGTAIVVLAGLLNAAKVVKKPLKNLKVVVSGAGAAGTATAKLLLAAGVRDVIVLDRKGALCRGRPGLNDQKAALAMVTNPRKVKGSLQDALAGADALIGVSGPGLAKAADIALMAERAIVFALANPTPEILPEEALRGGAVVVATGRSDFANQINNSLVFPGLFRGLLDKKIMKVTDKTKLAVAKALAGLVANPTAAKIIPDMLDPRVVKTVAKAVR
jgi:malate dehydrogenase (oxaloacetate-decarboxylating)